MNLERMNRRCVSVCEQNTSLSSSSYCYELLQTQILSN